LADVAGLLFQSPRQELQSPDEKPRAKSDGVTDQTSSSIKQELPEIVSHDVV
jgi:hypothetical protein